MEGAPTGGSVTALGRKGDAAAGGRRYTCRARYIGGANRTDGAETMMDMKDLLPIAFSVVATAIALRSSAIANKSLKLAQSRDQYDRDKALPTIDLDIPTCADLGPWQVDLRIRNNGTEPIIVQAIRIPIRLKPAAIPGRFPIRFAEPGLTTLEACKDPDGPEEFGDYERFALNENIEPNATVERQFRIGPDFPAPLRNPVEIPFYVDVTVRDRAQTSYRLPIKRTARPA